MNSSNEPAVTIVVSTVLKINVQQLINYVLIAIKWAIIDHSVLKHLKLVISIMEIITGHEGVGPSRDQKNLWVGSLRMNAQRSLKCLFQR